MYDLAGGKAHVLCVRISISQIRIQAPFITCFTSKLGGNTYIGVENKQFYQVSTGKQSNIAHINKILVNFCDKIKKKNRQCRTVRENSFCLFS